MTRYLVRYWKLALLHEERTDAPLEDTIKFADATALRLGASTVTIKDTVRDLEVYRRHAVRRD